MKHWEEAALLTELLDRHVQRLVEATPTTDWTIYWWLSPFLGLVRGEPILSAFVEEYVDQVAIVCAARDRRVAQILQGAAAAFAKHEKSLVAVRNTVEAAKRESFGLDRFAELLAEAQEHLDDRERTKRVLDCLHHWIGCGYDEETEHWAHSGLAAARTRVIRLRNELKRLALQVERLSACHPGEAYLRITARVVGLNYAASNDPLSDEIQNQRVERLRGYIRDTETWGDALGDLPQAAIINIQRDIRTLHLALVTSLTKGRSRLATVRRFAARCESFDRNRLVEELESHEMMTKKRTPGEPASKPEATLTLEFAKYLFDAGFNPLVDAAACGLRPDVLDATGNPAVYVEVKQYEKVGNGIARKLRADVAQTLNTWDRLSKRWDVPEAFLLIFRRSGRPIEIDEVEIRLHGRRLYVVCVDLAEAKESGSRAEEPVRLSARDLLARPSP